jgi:hypothetical protein
MHGVLPLRWLVFRSPGPAGLTGRPRRRAIAGVRADRGAGQGTLGNTGIWV